LKIDSMNINNVLTTTQKSNNRTSKNYDSFDRLFSRVSYVNDKRNLNNDFKERENLSNESIKNADSYRENSRLKSNVEEDSTKPVPKEVKDELKKAGMSDEEVDKINSLKDLKEKVEPDKLISILLSFMNLNVDSLDISNLKSEIGDQIKDILSSNNEKLVNIKDQSQLKNKLIDGLFEKITNQGVLTGSKQNEDLLAKIQAELAAALKDSLEDANVNEIGSKDALVDLKFLSKNLTSQGLEKVTTSTKAEENTEKDALADSKISSKNLTSQGLEKVTTSTAAEENTEENSTMFSGNPKTDDSFLKKLLSNDNDNNKISRVTSFMSHLNNMKVDNGAAVDLEKITINKNTLNSDIIKAFKFMQTNNMKDLTVKIMPKELGEVVINLTMEGGAMKATITATNKEAYNLLNSNLGDITNKLQNNDIKIQNLTLNIYNEDTTFFKNGQERNRSGNGEQKGKKTDGIGSIEVENNELDNLSETDSNVDMLA